MTTAILRGFDTPIEDLKDRLRLCNPLLSFEQRDTAEIFRARQLDWQASSDVQLLVPIDAEDAQEFCTLLRDYDRSIAVGYGVLVMGPAFAGALAGSLIPAPAELQFVPELGCYIGVATAEEFYRHELAIVEQAKDVMDRELAAGYPRQVSEVGELALHILRRSRSARNTDVAIRQLAEAFVNRKPDLYRRLLIRFAIDLDELEEELDQRVHRHLALVGRRTMRKAKEPREVMQRRSDLARFIDPANPGDRRTDELFAAYNPRAVAQRSPRPGDARYLSSMLGLGGWFDDKGAAMTVRSGGLSGWILDTQLGPRRSGLLYRSAELSRADKNRPQTKDHHIGWQALTH